MLYVVGALVGGAWAVGVALWSPVFLVPDGPGGIVVCGAFYLWPGLVIGFWASRLPKVRTLSCTACGWSEVREIRRDSPGRRSPVQAYRSYQRRVQCEPSQDGAGEGPGRQSPESRVLLPDLDGTLFVQGGRR